MRYFTIEQLKGAALEKALQDTNEAEFDGKANRDTLIDYNIITGARYDENGEFVEYRA